MPAHAGGVVNGVSDNECEVLDFGIPEAIVVHRPLDLLETFNGPRSREIFKEKAGGGKEGVSGPLGCCCNGGKILEPVVSLF